MKSTQASVAAVATVAWTAAAAATMGAVGFVGTAYADPEIEPCDIQQLAVAAGPSQAGAGHRAVQLDFTLQPEVSSCQVSGYPTVEALVPTGKVVPAKPTPQGYLGGAAPGTTVTLNPGRGAHALVEWVAAGSTEDPTCPTYGSTPTDIRLRVIPPGTWQTFDVSVSIGPNEGLCNLQVHPLTA